MSPGSGVRFANNTLVFAAPGNGRLYGVDTLNGTLTLWGTDAKNPKTVQLPTHPQRDRIVSDLRTQAKPNSVIVLHLYGIPTMMASGLLAFPGIRANDAEKTLFAWDTVVDQPRAYAPTPGAFGERVLIAGKEALLFESRAKQTGQVYFIHLKESERQLK